MWNITFKYAYRYRICFYRKVLVLTGSAERLKRLNSNKPLYRPSWARSYSTGRAINNNNNSRPNNNAFLEKLDLKCKDVYNNLPANSVLKRPDSLVNKRIKLSNLDVLRILYGLSSYKEIQDIFTTPDKLDMPGVYCIMSKDRSNFSYYIGSSVNMKRRQRGGGPVLSELYNFPSYQRYVGVKLRARLIYNTYKTVLFIYT